MTSRTNDPPSSDSSSASEGNAESADGARPAAPDVGFIRHFQELIEYVRYYISARVDRLKLSVRKAIFLGALLIVSALVGAAMIVTSAALLVIGFGMALGALFGGRLWLGFLVAGAVLLAVIFVGLRAAMFAVMSKSEKATVKKYASRRMEQRHRFGRDVEDAGDAARPGKNEQ